jgi:antitoxin VapB
MGLNIKNEEVHRLVKQLAEISGESQTEAIKHAVEERIQRLDRRQGRLEKILTLGKDCATRLKAKVAIADRGDFLFGPDGMPS